MSSERWPWVLASLALTLNVSGHSAIAQPAPLVCSAERPSVGLGESVALRAWALPAGGQRLTYSWAAMAGRVEERGAEARWNLADLRAGTYAATVNVSGAVG